MIVQRRGRATFLNQKGQWTAVKKEARKFPSVSAGIEFCLERDLRDIVLLVNSGEAEEETVLHPFSKQGAKTGGEVTSERTAELIAKNEELCEQTRRLIARLDNVIAENKERRKGYPFKSKGQRKRPEV